MSVQGFAGAAMQLLVFPPLQRTLGTLTLYHTTIAIYPALFAYYPLIAVIARHEQNDSTRIGVWIALIAALLAGCLANMV